MARDYRKLKAFALADELVVEIYRATRGFPREGMFGLTSQMRRAAASVAANMVEGSFRTGEAEYANFLSISLGSAGEVGYFVDLAERLGFLDRDTAERLQDLQGNCVRALQGLVSHYRPNRATLKPRA